VQAMARVYRNYTHVVARAEAGIATLAELTGKRVSTGSPNSGTDALAGRLLAAVGVDPEQGITRLRLSLPETTRGMREGTIDAMFFSGGLPTPGITDLIAPDSSKFVLVETASALPPLAASGYGTAYGAATIPAAAYGLPADVATVVVANLLVVSPTLPEGLGYDLTRLLFEHQSELTAAHPEAANLDRTTAADTDPVPLHPGAARFLATR
jgi:TRAP transporter TAXI family solute receptor